MKQLMVFNAMRGNALTRDQIASATALTRTQVRGALIALYAEELVRKQGVTWICTLPEHPYETYGRNWKEARAGKLPPPEVDPYPIPEPHALETCWGWGV